MLNIETTRADIIFKPVPAFIISLISNWPLPEITAFGGVTISKNKITEFKLNKIKHKFNKI